ncbi:MAG TPA: hypothetical protein VK464_28275 [Symbiobacteriaceae bacterium]|jgi:hypothetical protein|nr:hypothetical protein [Symbiobacteriaceae bacterium]
MDEKPPLQPPLSARTALAAGEQAMKAVLNRPVARVVRRNFKPPGLWNESPATLSLFRTAEWDLHDLAVEEKVNLGAQSMVTRVRVARNDGDPRVYIRPTDWDDPLGIPVQRKDSKTTINIYAFMAEAGMLLPVLRAHRHSLERDMEGKSPIGPALVFDTSAVLEQKTIKRKQRTSKKKSNQNTTPQEAAPAKPEQ